MYCHPNEEVSTLLGSSRGLEAMPENSKKMPSCNIDLIRIWIEEGAMDN